MSEQFSNKTIESASILQKESVKKLEKFATLSLHERFLIALVYLGLKPAAEVSLYLFDGDNEDVFKEDQIELSQLLNKLGLFFKVSEFSASEEWDPDITYTFYISQSQEQAKAFQSAFETQATDLVTLLGYPKTAIEAFSENTYQRGDEPPEVKEHQGWPFLYFALSQDHWEEELDFVAQQATQVKKHMPNLYEEMVQRSKRSE